MRDMNEAERKGAPMPDSSAVVPAETPAISEPESAETVESDAKTPARDEKSGQFQAKDARKGNPRHDPAARVEQATGKAAAAKAEADRVSTEHAAVLAERDELRRQLQERDAAPKPAPKAPDVAAAPVAPGKPKLDDYKDAADPLDAYFEALAEWKATSIVTQREQSREAARQHQTVVERFESAKADLPDLGEKIAAADAALSQAGIGLPAVLDAAIRESELGPQIAYFLGSHPEELVQLVRKYGSLPVNAATVVRDLLESRVSSAMPTAAVSTGPAAALPRPAAVPIRPVRTSREPAPPKDPTDVPFGREYMRLNNDAERKVRGA